MAHVFTRPPCLRTGSRLITGPAHVSHRRMSNATRNPDASDVFRTDRAPPVPTARALLAVHRHRRTADAGGTGGARSRPARGPVRRAAAAVLLYAGVPAVRGLRLRACGRPGASVGRYREAGIGDSFRHRARFYPQDAGALKDLFEIVGRYDATEVLVDDRPVPFAREQWLPLLWMLTLRVPDVARG